jgi:hypothetical protein
MRKRKSEVDEDQIKKKMKVEHEATPLIRPDFRYTKIVKY